MKPKAHIICLALLVLGACGDERERRGDAEETTTLRQDLNHQLSTFQQRRWEAPWSQASVTTSTFRHSLHATVPEANGIPLLDDKDDTNGARFAHGNRLVFDDGSVSKFSGVFTLESVQHTSSTTGPTQAPNAVPVVGADVSTEAALLSNGEQLEVVIHLRDPPGYEPMIYRMRRKIAEGQVTSLAERRSIGQQLVGEQVEQVRPVVDGLAEFIESAGGSVTTRCTFLPCLRALLDWNQLQSVAHHHDVVRVDKAYAPQASVISGAAVSLGTQMWDDEAWSPPSEVPMQFQDDNYLGDESVGNPLFAGVLSHQQLDDDHPAFLDSGDPSSSRIAMMRGCGVSPCQNVSSWSAPQGHATKVSGLVVGDLTDGQDPTVTNSLQQIRRSGYAREAELVFWRAPTDGNISTALDDIAYWAYPLGLHVINMSISEPLSADPYCEGSYATARDMNDVFEAGALMVMAAGNSGHTSATDCRVAPPAASIGTFVVGSHTNSWSTEDQTDVRYGAISSFSSRGGTWYQGDNRTIIDQTAPGYRTLMLNRHAGDPCLQNGDCGNNTVCTNGQCEGYDTVGTQGTSFAAPTVAGGAIELIDFYHDVIGNDIDDPGVLTANLLLMGDREAEGTGKHSSGYSNLWGSGRFKMRRWDDEGLDAPAGFEDFVTCIDDGTSYYHAINGGQAIPADANALKAVVYFYDPHDEWGYPVDDITLSLIENVGGYWYTRVSDTNTTDEKKRVFWDSFTGNNEWYLEISGDDVDTDSTSCGTDSMLVYVALFWEDSDRDDVNHAVPNGPGTNTDYE